MSNSTLFYDKHIDFTKEPLVFGTGRNIARTDLPTDKFIEKQTDRLLGLTWFPSDFSYLQDSKDFEGFDAKLQELFMANLKLQQLYDSFIARSVAEVLNPVVTNPHLERFVLHWSNSEAIHFASYSDLIKALPVNATKIFDDIMINDNILSRARLVIDRLEDLHKHNAKKTLNIDYNEEDHRRAFIFALYAIHILEAVMFMTSFIVTWAFAENGVMESSGKSMSKIAMDEHVHFAMTTFLINELKKEADWKYLFEEVKEEVLGMYKAALEADYLWIDYIFREGVKLLGLNANILKEYGRYNIYKVMAGVGLPPICAKVNNPCTWADKYTNISNIQTAMNEADGVNYLLGKLNKNMTLSDWDDLKDMYMG